MTLKIEAWENNVEYQEIVKDLLVNPQVQRLQEFVHHKFTNRLDHSITVSYLSYLLAKKFNLDYISVARASLLHDFFLLKRNEVEDLNQGSHNSLHPKLALDNALKITSLNDIERDIILKHMFLVTKVAPPKYRESFIVSMVDKYAAILEVSIPFSTKVQDRVIRAIYRLGFAN